MAWVTTPEGPPATRITQRVQVRVVEGPDQGAASPIDGEILVGTSEACHLRLTDRAVSRRHLLVRPAAIGVRLLDHESRNGTWQGEQRIHDIELPVGSEVRIGRTALRFEAEADDDRPPAQPVARRSFGRFLGDAPSLVPLYERLTRVAPTDSTVLLEGESGTGKELLAEAIHDESPRTERPFVVVDCGAMPESLIEAQLFGYEQGAFTGATRARPGAFETADGGTVFLDEVGEVPLALQTRLLRVLDRRTVQRLGSQQQLAVDVRVIAATHRNLERDVEDGRFRLDLFHRLAVVLLRVPPLREREGDVELLARELVRGIGGSESLLTDEILERMRCHPWPGNARELRNYVERLVVLGQAEELGGSGAALAADAALSVPYRRGRALAIERFNREYVAAMLEKHGGNVSAAARAAGVSRRYFQSLKSEG